MTADRSCTRGEHRGGIDLTNLNQPLGRGGLHTTTRQGRERAPRVSYLLPVPAIIATNGWILLVIGVVLLILGQIGRPGGGRRYWY